MYTCFQFIFFFIEVLETAQQTNSSLNFTYLVSFRKSGKKIDIPLLCVINLINTIGVY